jgi:ankyrin repeat protein
MRLLSGIFIALVFLMPDPLLAAPQRNTQLLECSHWMTSPVFDEFANHAVIRGKYGEKVFLRKANPDLCAQSDLHMGAECQPALSTAAGSTVTVGHVCGIWAYVEHATEVHKRKKWVSGWIADSRLKMIPPSKEDLQKQEEWKDHRLKNESELEQAIYRGDKEEVSKILTNDNTLKQSRHALVRAMIENRPDIVAIAIQHGARPDDDSASCQRELNIAANNSEILRQLIKAGWNPDCRQQSKNAEGLTALMYVAAKRRVGATPLTEPINKLPSSDPVETAKILVGAGADLNLTDSWRGNALRHALEANNVDVAAYLLDAGVEVNDVIDDSISVGVQQGNTTLMEALFWYTLTWDPTMIKLLLEHGANVNVINQNNYDAECDRTTKGKCTFAGQTVLTRSAEDGYLTIVKLLLEHGADPLLARKDGALPADIARQNGHPDVAKVIDEYIQKRKK